MVRYSQNRTVFSRNEKTVLLLCKTYLGFIFRLKEFSLEHNIN